MSEAYGAFAYAYDRALGRRFCKAARLLLDQLLESYPAEERTHLDVACGTGSAVQYFRGKGWQSIGVDGSLEMLQLAGGGVAGDMRRLPFRKTFARVTCLYDSLNHLLEPDDLTAAFQSIRGVMHHDSLFFFDMNHPEIYPEVWGIVDPYVSSGKDYHLELATTYRKRQRLGRAVVTGWARINGRRVEIREEHLQPRLQRAGDHEGAGGGAGTGRGLSLRPVRGSGRPRGGDGEVVFRGAGGESLGVRRP